MITKYQVGDRVRIRPDLETKSYWNENHTTNDTATDKMVEKAGQTVIISEILASGKYHIKEDDNNPRNWTDEMFDGKARMTRGDTIRHMTDEELASFLVGHCAACSYTNKKSGGCGDKECLKGISNWLKEKEQKTEKDLEYYMGLPYKLEIIPDMASGGYVMKYPELKGCISQCDRKEDVVAMAEDAKKAWLMACLEDGIEIPEPDRG